MNARRWTTDLQDKQPTYDQAEHFLRFLDKYVSHAVGNHYFLRLSKLNMTKTFIDKVTASEIAYTISVYKNSKKVWEEENCRSEQAQRLMMRGVRQHIKKQVS